MDDSCSSSSWLGNVKAFESSCQNSQRNLYSVTSDERLIRAAFCGDSLSYDDFLNNDGTENKKKMCQILKVRWQYDTFCDCNLAKLKIAGVENPSGTVADSQRIVRMMKEDFWSGVSTNYLNDLCQNTEFERFEYQSENGLSWDILIEACPQLERAGCYTPTQQIDMSL